MEPTYTKTVGAFAVTPLWDGTIDANMEGIRGLDPRVAQELIAAERARTGRDPVTMPVRAFLVRDGSRHLLVDAGTGNAKGPKTGLLPASLAKLGVQPEQISTILMTHIHMDHAGGLTDAGGKPQFPNAEIVLSETEARYFLDTPVAELDARSQRNVAEQRAILNAYGARVRRVPDGATVDGLVAMATPGHTPGHTAWVIRSRGQSMVVLGDVIHLGAVQLPRPDTAMIYDVDPVQAGATRRRVLDWVAKERVLVAGAHIAAPGIGVIVRAGEGYAFEPAA